MDGSRLITETNALSRLAELADYVFPLTLRALCELRLADHLVAGPRPIGELAHETGTHADSLARALRITAAKGIFEEVEPGCFGLTPMASLLRDDHPLSLREAFMPLDAEVEACIGLMHSLRTGEASFDAVHGQTLWDYLEERPTESARFDAMMRGLTRLEVRAALSAFPWREVSSVVDVGGGNGSFIAGLMRRNRGLCGIVFDLPHVVRGAAGVLDAAGVADRSRLVAGSFFDDPIPSGADVYVLKRILYSWHDDDARRMLESIRTAMREDSRLLIIEPLADTDDAGNPAPSMDLLMLVLTAGRSRTRSEFATLLASAGLRLQAVRETALFPMVEASAV